MYMRVMPVLVLVVFPCSKLDQRGQKGDKEGYKKRKEGGGEGRWFLKVLVQVLWCMVNSSSPQTCLHGFSGAMALAY